MDSGGSAAKSSQPWASHSKAKDASISGTQSIQRKLLGLPFSALLASLNDRLDLQPNIYRRTQLC
jgi:hypothetical protein